MVRRTLVAAAAVVLFGMLASARQIADRIVKLRDGGATWQVIADTLNAERVPTPRGGAEWRPSSVRSAHLTRTREMLAQAQATA